MFYMYSQNNSGGSFSESYGIAEYVIVEADSAGAADARAESIGLYFDGDGDCSCCGDRWSTQYGDGDAVPSIYGTPLIDGYKYESRYGAWTDPIGYVHYANGDIVVIETVDTV